MKLAPRLALAALLAGTATVQSSLADPPPDCNYVAVVVGLSTYQNLPEEVELNFARSDAATVAASLRDDAGFTEVFLLTGREASKEEIRAALRAKAAQLVGPDDVFVLYFVGHGIGADLDLPTLLAHDSTLENGQEDGLVLETMARDYATWIKAGSALVVTDAVHRNQLDGIYFYGPAANQWPRMPHGTMLVSSSQAQSPAKDGVFGEIFARAIGGAADGDGDGFVTAMELRDQLLADLADSGQTPEFGGTYDATMVLAAGVDRDAVASRTPGTTPDMVYPDVTIDKAKFVFTEGGAQQVQCYNKPVVECAPSCYIWDFKAGPCEVTAVINGVSMEGTTIILSRGKYDCARQGPDLGCIGPS